MRYKIKDSLGKWNYINDDTINKLPEEAIKLTPKQWQDRLKPTAAQTLKSTKESLIKKITFNRSQLAENSTITYNNKTYSNSQNARIAINYFINKLSPQESTKYFTYPEKEIVELYRTDFQKIATMIEGNEMYLREKEMQLIKEINNCKSLTTLNQININLTQQQNDNSN